MNTETTEAPKTKAQLKKEQLIADKARAEVLMKQYATTISQEEFVIEEYTAKCKPFHDELAAKLKKIQDKFNLDMEPLGLKREKITLEILEIATRNRKTLFGVDDNWKFEDADGHYLHVKGETVAKEGESFDLVKFIKDFGKYVTIKYKIKELKKVFTDAVQVKKIAKHDITLEQVEVIEIKKSAKE